MRSLLVVLPAVLSALAAGCEDGPAQSYEAPPPGAGSIWDGEDAGFAAPDGSQPFDAGYPTASKTVLCSTDFKRERWAWMLTRPIEPPRVYAGLDEAKDNQWDGLTIEDAERPPNDPSAPTGGLCQSNPLGPVGTCPSGIGTCNQNTWGNAQEVVFYWNVATHIVDQMTLQLGYTGAMNTAPYPDHDGEVHAYTLSVGDVVRRDGAPFELDWNGATISAQITDIFNATMATFAPSAGIPFDTSSCTGDAQCDAPGTTSTCQCQHAVDPVTRKRTADCAPGAAGKCGAADCSKDGNCLVQNDGSTTVFGIRPMVVYFQGPSGVPQPALSTIQLVYNFYSKWEPFSNLPQVVKLDAEGPVASGQPVGVPSGKSITCTQKIGQTFADLVASCVQVHGDTGDPNSVDVVNLDKLVHGLLHDQEHWTANVLGVNQNFTSSAVVDDWSRVVMDSDMPRMEDLAQDWTFDIRARGQVTNDFDAARDVWDFRGSALLMIEYARLLLADVARILGMPHPKKLGDPSCIGFDASGRPNYLHDKGCSGIEGMIIPNAAASFPGGVRVDFTGDPLRPDLDPGVNADRVGFYGSVLKPGDLHGAFCIDPDAKGPPKDCTANRGVSLWQNALTHVTRVLGGGAQGALPAELRDRRYYFKWFGIAYVKYLKAYGSYGMAHPATVNDFPHASGPTDLGTGLGPSYVMGQPIDLESLFFDYTVSPGQGAGQTFDKFEYIDRDFIGQGAGGAYNWIPWDFEYGCDLFAGNQRYDHWYRRMDREEIAMYGAMLTDKTHTPGQENDVNITNLFGSTLLGGDPAAGIAGVWPSYACAVGRAGDPAKSCGGVNAPLDPNNPSGASPCNAGGGCPGATQVCGGGPSHEAGMVKRCGAPCDFTAFPASGCKSASQTCAGGACLDMMMDKNGPAAVSPHPLLWAYPGAWARTPFSRGHSPITLAAADKAPDIGVAWISIPNFAAGPYTPSPLALPSGGTCPGGYSPSANGVWCDAVVGSGMPDTPLGPSYRPPTPWLEVQPEVGFSIPLDAQHSQWVTTGRLDFTGVLESYVVDYLPYADPGKPSCVADGACNKGFVCDPTSRTCLTDDGTLQIAAIEGSDFLGQAFVCADPATGDVLHVGMYDSAQSILAWLAAHPAGRGAPKSAEDACQILVIRSPYDNYVDRIVSKAYGVSLKMGGGQGQGRVTDIVLFDPSLIHGL
jgi:hypothetical protein